MSTLGIVLPFFVIRTHVREISLEYRLILGTGT